MIQTILLHCSLCKKAFNKCASEYNRKKRNGFSKFYCSSHCFHADIDELAPFRRMFYQARQSAKVKHLDFDLTLDFLKKKWELQMGRCPYTNIKMILPSKLIDPISSPKQASIDRVNPKKGYTQDNIELVTLFINLGKNKFSSEAIKDLISEI